MYSVTKRIDFCYGHRLLDYDGVCKHPHGHNATVEIEVRTGSLDNRNMVCDFSDIKRDRQGLDRSRARSQDAAAARRSARRSRCRRSASRCTLRQQPDGRAHREADLSTRRSSEGLPGRARERLGDADVVRRIPASLSLEPRPVICLRPRRHAGRFAPRPRRLRQRTAGLVRRGAAPRGRRSAGWSARAPRGSWRARLRRRRRRSRRRAASGFSRSTTRGC